MNFLSGENGYEPSCEEYVKSYIRFYAKREGKNIADGVVDDCTDEISLKAKTHLVDDLYKNLDTLDSKAGAILTYCGVVLASIAIMISSKEFSLYKPILYIVFLAISVSSVLALTVINVHWSSARELGQRTLEDACYSYYTAKVRRTKRYILAWYITVFAILIMGGYIVIDQLFKHLGVIAK